MAITYNGTPITAATWRGVDYKSISYNGCAAYVNTDVCWRSAARVYYEFMGFDYKRCYVMCSGSGHYDFYARAKVRLKCNNDKYASLSWREGIPMANNVNDLFLWTRSEHHMSCVCLLYKGCGWCEITYTFPVTSAPFEIGKACSSDDTNFGLSLNVCDTSISGMETGFVWNRQGGCCLYGDWVEIDYCDYYYSNICCTGYTVKNSPVIYLSNIVASRRTLDGGSCTCTYHIQDTTGTCMCGWLNMVLC